MQQDKQTYRTALDDFRRLRSRAAMDRFWAGIRGESLDLLPYHEVSSKLRAVSQTNLGLQVVPLEKIIGSVNRTDDFDRNFRPLSDDDITRWANVKTAMTSPFHVGVPPVSLYKIGDAYFALDGNHRISIAKEMGLDTIEAYVTEVKTKVPISSSFTLEELVEKAAYADFLEDTHVDRILPDIDFSLKRFEQYPLLKEHINVHQYYMGIERNREVGFEEAALDWYDQVYAPVARIIDDSGLRYEFPEFTVTDLYLWVLDKQEDLRETYGTPFKTENVVDYVASREGKWTNAVGAVADRELDSLHSDCLFRDILVGISHTDPDLVALQQAKLMNRCEEGNIVGLHVLSESDTASVETEAGLETSFYNSLHDNQMDGRFIMVPGSVSPNLREYSLLSDVLIVKLSHPPAGSVIDRLSSGVITLLQNSRRPVMFVKDTALRVERILLIYDAAEKSREAFFIAAYYAARYNCELYILMPAKEDKANLEARQFAQDYLVNLNLQDSTSWLTQAQLDDDINAFIEEKFISTIILGGYKSSGLLGRIFSSSIDAILENSRIPVLVCQ